MEIQRELQALFAITTAINVSMSLSEVLATLLERTVAELHYRAATLRLFDEERQTLELKAAYGLSEAYLTKGPVDLAKSGVDREAMAGRVVSVIDVRNDPGFQYGKAAANEGLASVLILPLMARKTVIGVLRIYTATAHTFSPDEQYFLEIIANLGAQAIQRTRLYEAFHRIAHHVNSSLELPEVLSTLLIESVTRLNVKAASIRLLGPNQQTLHLAAAYGLSSSYLQKGAVLVNQSLIDQRVLEEGQPIVVADVTTGGLFQYPEAARREEIRSVLVLPLRAHTTTIGVMRMYSAQVRRFSTEEIAFAATIAALGAVAIENARLHQALKARLEALKEDADGWYRFLTMS